MSTPSHLPLPYTDTVKNITPWSAPKTTNISEHGHSCRHRRAAKRLCRVSVSSATASDCQTDCMLRLYKTSEGSDCKIICGSYTFDAHRVVLRSQSEFFKTALKSGTFKVRYHICTLATSSLTVSRREKPESSSSKRYMMAPTLLTFATNRRLSSS